MTEQKAKYSLVDKVIIVTTTINSPTEATLKYKKICDIYDGWEFVVVGDKKTPHDEYEDFEHYLSPEKQEELYPELSEVLGWNTIQRRNIGFVYAYELAKKSGAKIVATVDDDNIPYDNWGLDIAVGKKTELDVYLSKKNNVFDPLSVTEHNYLWHRGFPIELLRDKNDIEYRGREHRKILVQADLWDGDPDIDAMARLTHKPIVKFSSITERFAGSEIAPFNSQNTFIDVDVLKDYFMFPFIGRMDDIWGSYIFQLFHPSTVCYAPATVYQDRNVQDLVRNLENEIIGYRNTKNLLMSIDYLTFMEKNYNESYNAFMTYRKYFK